MTQRSGRISALLGVLLVSGCARVPLGNAPLTIASSWSADERLQLQRDFARWIAPRLHPEDGPIRIDWVVAQPGDDLVRLAMPPRHSPDWRARPLDLMVGGPASVYADLARRRRLTSVDRDTQPLWCVARRTAIGWAHNTKVACGDEAVDFTDPLGTLSQPDTLAFDDPRHDTLTLVWAKGVLNQSTWADGYAALVKGTAHAARVARQPGAALGAVERGEAVLTPAVPASSGGNSVAFADGRDPSTWVEGVAIIQGGDNPSMAQLFLEFLATRGLAETPQTEDATDPDADALLADLLGATLVDAQNELGPAWNTWERAGRTPLFGRLLTEAPPWPPASIDKLLKTEGAGPLLDTLAEQLTPDADLRAWLLRSWLAPTRPVDGALLADLSSAMDGRLVREPRFRAWLRGEWTAWARQRYRRVERQVGVVTATAGNRSEP